jgi:LAO/AO transport system kinase
MSQQAHRSSLTASLLAQNRHALSRAITLVESSLPSHRLSAYDLILDVMAERARDPKDTYRIGISGPPGAGKSTFIEAFGMFVINKGKRVAVLAVDPSSERSGGSILGDKTRMVELSCHDSAYIRPSPSSGSLGGVTRSTMDSILLCEAARFDVVLVETVGVGQSETAVEGMVDAFVLIVPPAGGDDLQGIKRGIVEMADLILVNKADGDLLPAARRTCSDYSHAVRLLRPKYSAWVPPVILASAKTRDGLGDLWLQLDKFKTLMAESGEWHIKRERQSTSWMWKAVHEQLLGRFDADPEVRRLLPPLEQDVRAGRLTPAMAADRLLAAFMRQPALPRGA